MHAPVRFVIEDLCNSRHGAQVHGLVCVLRAASMWSEPLEAGFPEPPKLGVPQGSSVPAELLVRQGDVSLVGVRRPVAVKALLELRSISVLWLLLRGLRPHVSERLKRHVVGEGEDCSKGGWAHGLGRAGGLGFGFGSGSVSGPGLGLKELGGGEDGGVRGGDGCGCGGGEGGQRLGGDGNGGGNGRRLGGGGEGGGGEGGGDGGGEGKGSGSGSGSGLGSGSACARVARARA